MYRKRFEPQIKHLPENYCGWAAEQKAESREEKLDCERSRERDIEAPALPCPVEKDCPCGATELSDLLLIGALIFVLLSAGKGSKPDLALLIPLGLLLFVK